MDALGDQRVAPVLEGLLDDEAHSREPRPGLTHQVEDPFCGVAVGQEVVDEQHVVARMQVIPAHADVVVPVLRKGVDRRGEHVLHRARALLLREDHRELHQVARHDGRGDAARLDREDLVGSRTGETPHELLGNCLHQHGIHLVVDEVVDLQDAPFEAPPFGKDPLFE